MSNNDEGPINYCLRKNELIKNYLLSNLNEAQTDEESKKNNIYDLVSFNE